MPDATAPQVSPKFAAVPQNPNIQPTQPAQPVANPSEGTQPPAQPTANPQQPTPGQGTHDKLATWLNILNNPEPPTQGSEVGAGAGSLQVTPPPLPTPPQQTVPSTPSTPSAPSAPTQQPDWSAQYALMQQQNQELQAKLKQQNQVIQNLMQSQQDYTALKNQVDANNIQFGELSTVEADDAKAIAAGIMKAMNAQLEPIKQALQQQQQYTQQSNQWQEQRFVQQQAQDTIRRIQEKHPDFVALQSDPNYLSFVQQRDGSSSLSYDALAAYEFQRGNADYIIDLINRYKMQRQGNNPADIATVTPVSTASAPAPASTQPELPTLQELNQWMQMRRINQDQYRALLQKIIAAQKG